MRFLKIFTIILSLLFIPFTVIAEEKNLTFPACDYVGQVDEKLRANGAGICKFKDGNVFEGTFKKNKLKKGKFTNSKGETFYEGKIRFNKFYVYLDGKKVRSNYKVNLDVGLISKIEMKKMSKWYDAELVGKVYQLTKEGLNEFQKAQMSDGGNDGGSGGGGCGG